MSKVQQKHPLEGLISGLTCLNLCLGPLLFGGVYPSGVMVLSWFAGAALMLWLVLLGIHSRFRLLWPPICWVVILFFVYAIWRGRGLDAAIMSQGEQIRVGLYAATFLLAVNFLHRQETIQWMVLSLVLLATLLACYGIIQVLTHSDAVWHLTKPAQYGNRATATYFCPNHLAGFLEMVLPLGLAYLFAGRLNMVFKVFLGYACLVITVGIGLTLSRGGALATGVSVCCFLLLLLGHRKYRLQAAVAMLGLLVVGYLVMERADFLGERFHQAFERENSPEQNVRPLIWKAGMTMWQDHKLMGAGPGQFDALFPLYRPAAVQERPGWMHNDYLQLLVEYGTIGASLLALGMLLLLAGAWKTRKYVLRQGRDLGNQRHSNRAAFVMGASISLVAIAVHSLLDFNLYIPANGLLAVALAGMLVSHLRFTTESHWWRCFWPNRVFAALLCLGLLMVVCDRMSARFLSSYWEAQARLHPKGSDAWLDGLSRAAQAQPERFDLPFEVGEWLLARGRKFQVGHEQDLETSLAWFDRSMQAWPSYPYAYLMKGHALDSLRRSEEAESYYKVAASLDPRSSQVMAYWGLHEIEMGQLEAAHEKFETSWDLRWYGNHLARDYLRILKQRLDLPPLTNPETGEIIH